MTSKIDMPVTPCEVEEMLPKTKYMTAAEFEERVCDKLNKISKDYDDQAQRIMAAIKQTEKTKDVCDYTTQRIDRTHRIHKKAINEGIQKMGGFFSSAASSSDAAKN